MEVAFAAWRPVRSEYRAGVQSGEVVNALEKVMPSFAIESRFGERPCFAPYAVNILRGTSSKVMRRISRGGSGVDVAMSSARGGRRWSAQLARFASWRRTEHYRIASPFTPTLSVFIAYNIRKQNCGRPLTCVCLHAVLLLTLKPQWASPR